MKILLPFLILQSSSAYALDSRALSEERIKLFHSAAFYCETGRSPLLNSAGAWAIQPTNDCRFSGPLDTKINRLRLESPVLNPTLSLADLKAILTSWNIPVDDRGGSLAFRLANGPTLTAANIDNKKMVDPLFHFSAYPSTWGKSFVSISASREDALQDFIAFAAGKNSALFWQNPHYEDEVKALPKLLGPRSHSPLEIYSHCHKEWKKFGGTQSLLLVGDMHTPASNELFRSILAEKSFSWAGLEISQDHELMLQNFLAAAPSDEEKYLASLTDVMPNDTVEGWKSIFRTLKAQHTKIVLIDYKAPYFNFPYTNASFHGMVMATRNLLWVNRLPASWSGTAVLFAGVDHFVATPSADFQNYAWERFPRLELGLVNPLEKCTL
jgi:hypothetical protein